ERPEEPVARRSELAASQAEAKAREEELKKELAEARKISEAKGAQIARQDSKIEGLEAKVKQFEAANAALERESTKAVKQLEGEVAAARKTLPDQSDRRAAELEQERSAPKKDLSKSLHDLKSAQAESAAARKEFREKEIVLTTQMTRAQGSVDQEKDKSAGLKDELEDLKKRLGRAGDLTARETEIKEQRTKFE